MKRKHVTIMAGSGVVVVAAATYGSAYLSMFYDFFEHARRQRRLNKLKRK